MPPPKEKPCGLSAGAFLVSNSWALNNQTALLNGEIYSRNARYLIRERHHDGGRRSAIPDQLVVAVVPSYGGT